MIPICSSVFSCDILSDILDLSLEDPTRVGLDDKARRHTPLQDLKCIVSQNLVSRRKEIRKIREEI